VLEIRGKHNRLVAGLSRKLDAQIPSLERDEDEVEVLRRQMFRGKSIEAIDGISESAGIPNVLPGQRGQTRWDQLVSNKAEYGIGANWPWMKRIFRKTVRVGARVTHCREE
jgi:hypothetical protein